MHEGLGVDRQHASGPLVSVVMTNYNYAPYLPAAVESVWRQTYRPIELVVVDDGSTDGSWRVLEDLRRRSDVPMYLVAGAHGGAASALNLGIEHAGGEFINYLHADDVLAPDRVSTAVRLLRAHPEAVLAHCEYECIDENGDVLPLDSSMDLPPAEGDALRDLLLLRADVRSVTMTVRRSALAALGPLDESLASEDWQLILRLAATGQIVHSDQPLVRRRVHGANASLRLQGNLEPHFQFEEIGLSALRDVLPADMELARVAPLHAGTILRVAVARGNLRKARDCYRKTLEAFPGASTRRTLRRAAADGAVSFGWRYVAPMLPTELVRRLRLRRSRIRDRAAGSHHGVTRE